MKQIFKNILSHLCFWREIKDEAKSSLKYILPLVIAIGVPFIYPGLISLTYSNQSVVERKAVVLDQDNSALSRDLMLSIDATQGVDIVRRVNSVDDGIEAVMSREADAFIFFPDDFSSRIKHFEQGELKVYVYATNMMIYAAALTGITQTVLDKNVQIAVERLANPNGITGERAIETIDPIQYERQMLFAPTLAYASYISPILFLIVFHQMGLLVLGFGVGYRREHDEDFKKRKLYYIDYFWRYLFYLMFIIFGTFVVYGIITPFFGWPCDNPLEMMKLALFLVVCQMPLSILIASFCKDRYASFQYILGLSLFVFTLSGYVWPIYAMPDWAATVSDYLGIRPAASAMRKITYKNMMFADCPQEIYKLIRLSFIYFILSLVAVHRDLITRPIQWLWHRIRPEHPATPDASSPSDTPEPKVTPDTSGPADTPDTSSPSGTKATPDSPDTPIKAPMRLAPSAAVGAGLSA